MVGKDRQNGYLDGYIHRGRRKPFFAGLRSCVLCAVVCGCVFTRRLVCVCAVCWHPSLEQTAELRLSLPYTMSQDPACVPTALAHCPLACALHRLTTSEYTSLFTVLTCIPLTVHYLCRGHTALPFLHGSDLPRWADELRTVSVVQKRSSLRGRRPWLLKWGNPRARGQIC